MTKNVPPISKELSAFLAKLTSEPGVYRMLNEEGVILYVGKAANLKKRVSSYFSQRNVGVKTRALVSQIKSIEISITRSETEALLLESSLIKSIRPKYNVLMRDDKSYPFIHLSTDQAFPGLSMVRRKKSTSTESTRGGMYFGPYPSGKAVRETINIIQKVFKIRNCNDIFFNNRARPCLQYQIKRCSAPCTAYILEAEYQRSVKDAIRFLQGKSQQILEDLASRMEEAARRWSFEEAAHLRDQIKSLRLIQEQQGVVRWRGELDVIVLEAHPGFACVQCVTVREGQVLGSERFFPSVPKHSLDDDEDSLWQRVFLAFVTHHYLDTPERIPGLILTDREVEAPLALEQVLTQLRGKSCQIQTRPRGANARWLDFALNNLQMAITEVRASATLMQMRFQALSELLHIQKPISRMECFDISHTQGAETVASCVVFDENGPCKREYRRFNISGITPGDDYAAMEQVLIRRFKRQLQTSKLSDVLIVDGGKAQVAVAKRVLTLLNIENIILLGIAKGASRKAGWERLIIEDQHREITLPMDSPALHLLQHIRDESRRFAITAHRKKRHKTTLTSSLESIEGIGAKRRQSLLIRFGGIRELARASIVEIAKVQGINQALAKRIYAYFHEE